MFLIFPTAHYSFVCCVTFFFWRNELIFLDIEDFLWKGQECRISPSHGDDGNPHNVEILSLLKTIRLISWDCQVHCQMTKLVDGCNSKEVFCCFCCFCSYGAFSCLAVNCHLIKVKKRKKVGPLKGLLLMFPENQWHHC